MPHRSRRIVTRPVIPGTERVPLVRGSRRPNTSRRRERDQFGRTSCTARQPPATPDPSCSCRALRARPPGAYTAVTMTSEPTALFDLPAYLRRVGLTGAPPASSAGLGALHQAHVTHIPFENADVVLGRPVRLDPDSLQRKLVRECRGGYCFEQNLLFAAALEAIGLRVTKLAARVRYRATRLLPRTHMLLKVEADGGPWLADVGFGGGGLILPLPLAAGAESRQHSWTYRLTREAGTW